MQAVGVPLKRHVRRPRLTQLLQATPAPTLVVAAPAGFGKTILVAEWLISSGGGAWYRTTAAAATDVAAFVAGVAAAVERVTPAAGASLRRALAAGDSLTRTPPVLAAVIADEITS